MSWNTVTNGAIAYSLCRLWHEGRRDQVLERLDKMPALDAVAIALDMLRNQDPAMATELRMACAEARPRTKPRAPRRSSRGS